MSFIDDVFNSSTGRLGLGLLAAAGPRADGAGFGQRLMDGVGAMDNWQAGQRAGVPGNLPFDPALLPLLRAGYTPKEVQEYASTLGMARPEVTHAVKSVSPVQASSAYPVPGSYAINRLKMSPEEAALFDSRYGPGAAAKILEEK